MIQLLITIDKLLHSILVDVANDNIQSLYAKIHYTKQHQLMINSTFDLFETSHKNAF